MENICVRQKRVHEKKIVALLFVVVVVVGISARFGLLHHVLIEKLTQEKKRNVFLETHTRTHPHAFPCMYTDESESLAAGVRIVTDAKR